VGLETFAKKKLESEIRNAGKERAYEMKPPNLIINLTLIWLVPELHLCKGDSEQF
jgi:hypothetical protein